MREKNKSLLKNIGLFTLGSFGSKILSFLLVPLYTSVLSTSEYGTVDLVISTALLLTPILLLSIFDATLRFGMDIDYKKEDVLSTSIRIAAAGSLVLIVGAIVVSVTDVIEIDNIYLCFLCVYFILGAMNQIFNLYLRAKNQAGVIAVGGVLCTFITCCSNVLLLLVFKFGIIGYMISNTIGLFIQNLYQLFLGGIYRDIKFWRFKDLSKPMVTYSSPLIVNSISWWINDASDRYVLTFLRGIAENGIYSVSYKIPTLLSVLQGIFYNAWSISAISEFDQNDSDGFIGMNYSLYSFISLAVCSGLLIINMPLASFLYKGDYYAAWKCVPFLLLGTVFSGIAQFEGSLFAAVKDTKSVAKTTVIGAAVNTICNFGLIYWIGSIGAALATLLGYFITWYLRTKHVQTIVAMKVKWPTHFTSIVLIFVQTIMATVDFLPLMQVTAFVLLILLNRSLLSPMIKKILKR